jgi:integrase
VRLGAFVEDIYLPHTDAYLRLSTSRAYRRIWDSYFRPIADKVLLRDVRTVHVQRWLEAIAAKHDLSKTTMSHAKAFLSGVFRHAATLDYTDGKLNPVAQTKLPAFARPAGQPGSYSLDDILGMLRLCDGLKDPAPGAAIALAAFSALRKSEIQGLEWRDYTPAASEDELGTLNVQRSCWHGRLAEPKTAKSKAPVPVIPVLAMRLTAYRRAVGNPASGPILPNPQGKHRDLDALWRRHLQGVLKSAGIEWKGWHGFRRGLASNLNRLGIDDSVTQAILRHSDMSTTQRCYIQTTRPDAQAAMRKLSEAFSALKDAEKPPATEVRSLNCSQPENRAEAIERVN